MSSRYQGTGVYCYNLARELMRIDPENEYALLQKKRPGWHELPCPPNFRPAPVRRFYVQDQRFSPLLDQLHTPIDLVRQGAELYHAPSIHYWCGLLPCAGVVTILDMIPLVFPETYTKTGLKHRLLYRLAGRADRILTPSESARRDVHRFLGIPLERISVTPFAAEERFRPVEDPGRVGAVLAKYGIKKPYLLYAGGFTQKDPRKNVMRLVEVYAELRRQRGLERVTLVLAGKKGPYSEALLRDMSRRGLGSGVLFPGHVNHDDLPCLYTGASCFVFPSSYEGFGMPPLEAISCGTPVVAYNNSSLPEVLGDGGILVEEDSRSLLEAIQAVLSRTEVAAGLRERGLRRAVRFSWEKTARLTLGSYLEVLEHRRAGAGS